MSRRRQQVHRGVGPGDPHLCAGAPCPTVLAGPNAAGLCAACRAAFARAGIAAGNPAAAVEPLSRAAEAVDVRPAEQLVLFERSPRGGVSAILDVLDRLERVRGNHSGVQWSARCPAHHDRNPSLSIKVGHDGRVLLHCHAGCPVGRLRHVGLEMRDLFERRGAESSRPSDAALRDGRTREAVVRGGDVSGHDLAALLNALVAFVRRFVVLDEAQAVAVALWVAHTWTIEAAHATSTCTQPPAEAESGKTRLLEVSQELARNPLSTMNISRRRAFSGPSIPCSRRCFWMRWTRFSARTS